jgi:uncharacterized protein (TIGR03382 family)
MLKQITQLMLALSLVGIVGLGSAHAGGVITDGRLANDSNQQNEDEVESCDSNANAIYLFASMIFYGHEAAALNERIQAEVGMMESEADTSDDSTDDEDGGCQAAAPMAPVLALALMLRRRRRS